MNQNKTVAMYSDIDMFNKPDKPTRYTAKHNTLMLHSNSLHVSTYNRNTWNCVV